MTLCTIASIGLFAQSPDLINYQAVARDGSGNILDNENMDVRIGVYSGAGAATLEYEEEHNVTTNAYGLFSLQIGAGTPTSGTLAGVDWASDEHHLKVELDDGGGWVDMGTNEFVSVPYALQGPHWESNINGIHYDADNFVGIGTSTRLNANTGLQVYNSTGTWFGSWIQTDDPGRPFYGYAQGTDNSCWTEWDGTDNDTWKLYNGDYHMGVTTDGDVGIGTVSPTHRFEVHEADVSLRMINIEVTNSILSGNDMFQLKVPAAAPDGFQFFECERGTDIEFQVNGDGTVGINRSGPQAMLHVKQETGGEEGIAIENDSDTDIWDWEIGGNDLNFNFNGSNVGYWDDATGNYTATSDAAFKKDITYISQPVLSSIMQLKPAAYRLIHAEETSQKAIGFIAQEVQAVIPELVRTKEDGTLSIHYPDFGVYAIKAIQEQQEIIDAQQRMIEELSQRLDNLESK